MVSPWIAFHMTAVMVTTDLIGGQESDVDNVGDMIRRVVKQDLAFCDLMVFTTATYSQLFSSIRRNIGPAVVLAVDSYPNDDNRNKLWESSTLTCRAIILHLEKSSDNVKNISITNVNSNVNLDYSSSILALRLLEEMEMWKFHDTYVVVVGGTTEVYSVLLHHSLRNTLHRIYIAAHYDPSPRNLFHAKLAVPSTRYGSATEREIKLYRSCLFCNNGDAGVEIIQTRNLSSSISPIETQHIFNEDQMKNFLGHKIRIISISHFPYVDYVKNVEGSNTVILKDSLDARLIKVFVKRFNFTYVINEEPKRVFGLEEKGKFSGLIGLLQREEADISTLSAPTPSRLKAVDYMHGYPPDLITIVSLQPTVFPQDLALIRPFSVSVWLSVGFTLVFWCAALWLMQRGGWMTGGSVVPLDTAFMYGWGALLEQPPDEPTITTSGQVLVGWWLVFCLVVSTGFRSSLVAHLTVQGTVKPIETLQDLVSANGWQWSVEPWLMNGILREYFSKHNDSVIKHVYEKAKILKADVALRAIKKGKFSLLHFERYIRIIIESYYMDDRRRTPFYISKNGFPLSTSFGWSFRSGAPYIRKFRLLMQRLDETGIIGYWLKDVIKQRIKGNRKAARKTLSDQHDNLAIQENNEIPTTLGLEHLQGAFYLLFVGCSASLLILVVEQIYYTKKTG